MWSQTADNESEVDYWNQSDFNIVILDYSIFKSLRTCSELNFYLNDDIFFDNEDIFKYSLKMWKNIKHRYSTIVLMTKNILSISASDIDVEWIFNTACDVCYYCWNCLNSDTIEMIMLMKWYKKLELWKFEKNSDSSNEKKKTEAETDEVWIDE